MSIHEDNNDAEVGAIVAPAADPLLKVSGQIRDQIIIDSVGSFTGASEMGPDVEAPSSFDSIGAAAMGAGAFGAILQEGDVVRKRHEPVPGFNPAVDLLERGNADSELYRGLIKSPETNAGVIDRLHSTTSPQEVDEVLQSYRINQRRSEIAAANGLLPQIVGTGVGVLPEILTTLTMPMTGITSVGTGARVAGLAMGETALGQSLQSLNDTNMGFRDVAFATALAGIIGGGAGVALGRLGSNLTMAQEGRILAAQGIEAAHRAGVKISEEAQDFVLDTAMDMSNWMGAAAGTGATAAGEIASGTITSGAATPAPGARSLVLSRTLPAPVVDALRYVRAPKQYLTDAAAIAQSEGRTGWVNAYDVMDRIMRLPSRVTGAVTGAAARRTAVDVGEEINDAFRAVQQAGIGEAAKLKAAGVQRITNLDLDRIGDRAAGLERAGRAGDDIVPVSIRRKYNEDQLRLIRDAARRQMATRNEVYFKVAQRLNRAKKLPDEAVVPGYRPRLWKAAAILANPERFKAWLARATGMSERDTHEVFKSLTGARTLEEMIEVGMDSAGEGSGRLMKRKINFLRDEEFTDEAAEFIETDSDAIAALYSRGVGRQLALREATADLFGEGEEFTIDALKRKFLNSFDEDIKANRADRTDLERAEWIFDKTMDEWLGRDLSNAGMHLAAGASSAAVATTLGNTAISMIGDVISTAFAGGRFGQAFKAWVRNPRTSKAIAEAAKEDPWLGVVLRGGDHTEDRRLLNLLDMDDASLISAVQGRNQSMIGGGLQKVAQMQMWANGMIPISRNLARATGIGAARQIAKDAGSWSSLTPALRASYQRLGIDGNMAGRINKLLREHGETTSVGGMADIRFPNTAKWSDVDQEALSRYTDFIRRTQKEALPSPELGDLPFLRHNAWGRVLMIFKGYAYSFMTHVVSRLRQEIAFDPKGVRPYGAFIAIMGGGFLQYAMRGMITEERRERFMKELDSPDAFSRIMWRSMSWSGLLPEPTLTLSETFSETGWGRRVNDLAETMAGIRPLPESSSRWQEQQSVLGLGGPLVGLLGTTSSIIDDATNGGEFNTTRLRQRTPIANTLLATTMLELVDGDQK